MGDEARPARARSQKARSKREEEVRKKYDFSVIRTLRQHRGLTIEKFAKLCGLSYAPISRIETNLIKPNLETLDKIAGGLGISTYNLVAMAEKREAETQTGKDVRAGAFEFKVFSFDGFDVSYGSAPRGAEASDVEVRQHDYESIVVRGGVLEVTVNEKTFKLEAGQCLQYDRVFPHKFRAVEDCELIVIGHSKR